MPLNQYRGPLTPAQAAEGINAAIRNARRLVADAQILFDAERFPSAASLAILAIEEAGKPAILRGLLVANSEKARTADWRRYRTHADKNYLMMIPELVHSGARTLADIRPMFTDQSSATRRTFDVVKQLGFYTDCCGTAHWSIPTDAVDRNLAELALRTATVVTSSNREVTVHELDLWQAHMASGLTRANLMRWCRSVVAAGLYPPEYAEEMRRFAQTMAGSVIGDTDGA